MAIDASITGAAGAHISSCLSTQNGTEQLAVPPPNVGSAGNPTGPFSTRNDNMNMMTAIQVSASRESIATSLREVDQAEAAWEAAFSGYLSKRDYERSLPIDDPAGDDAVEAMCSAMDYLIEDVRAPNDAALQIKLELARERCAPFVGFFDTYRTAMVADHRRLAGETDAEIAASPPRGSHAICEEERDLFVDLPDLRMGRTLDDALKHLTCIAAIDPEAYPGEWLEEIDDIGAFASANYPKDGARHLSVGWPCDDQEAERRRRRDALCAHLKTIDGMSERVADLLERLGRYSDNRPRDMRETTAALRDFVAAGFRVFLHPDGQLGSSGSMPKEWVHSGPERAAEIENAARRYGRACRRWRNEPQIKRAIRMLGTVESNGFVVLQRKGN